ncbi:hypothetical protein WJX77_003272 [Trebouxia sp. C0004]
MVPVRCTAGTQSGVDATLPHGASAYIRPRRYHRRGVCPRHGRGLQTSQKISLAQQMVTRLLQPHDGIMAVCTLHRF